MEIVTKLHNHYQSSERGLYDTFQSLMILFKYLKSGENFIVSIRWKIALNGGL